MTPQHLERRLKTLADHGTPLPDAADGHAVWAFDAGAEPQHLHFFPAPAKGRGIRFFFELQALQKAAVPAEVPVALLKGFRLAGRFGDAVIVRPRECVRPLGRCLLNLHLAGEPVPHRRRLVGSVIDLLRSLHVAKRHFGRRPVDELQNCLGVSPDGAAAVLDPLSLRRGTWGERDLRRFGEAAGRYASRTELLRGWRALTGTDRPAPTRGVWPAVRLRPPRAFGLKAVDAGGWRLQYADRPIFPQRHSAVRRPDVDLTQWPAVWLGLLGQIERGDLPAIKRDPSGEVLAAAVRLGSRDVKVIVKRPRAKSALRGFTGALRTPRARRAWRKAWNLLALGFAVEQPLLLAERRQLGKAVESLLVFERVPGPTLAAADWDAMDPAARETLLRRCGRVLRRLERAGFCHFDSKSTNWIVYEGFDGPEPVLLDLDGIRPYRWDGFGPRRLLRAVRQHPHFRDSDAAAVVAGYSPFGGGKSTNEHE